MAQNTYGGLIWTHHALERLGERGISQENALRVFRSPDKAFPGKNEGSYEYIKQFGDKRVTLIGKQNDSKEWIIISAWIDPPLPGSKDEKKQLAWKAYKKASWWKKILLATLAQIGIK